MSKIMIIKLITVAALKYGVSPEIAISVAAVESQFNPNVIGITHDIGVFQLNPKSFPEYTKAQLLDPITNIDLGVKYLAKVKKECNHQEGITWLTCFNAGKRGAKKIKHPTLFPYVKKIVVMMEVKQ